MNNEEYIIFIGLELDEAHGRAKTKGADYTGGRGPFYNYNGASAFGVDPIVGLMIRMADKFRRLESFALTENLEHESLDDTFRDLIGYSLSGLAMLEDMRNRNKEAQVVMASTQYTGDVATVKIAQIDLADCLTAQEVTLVKRCKEEINSFTEEELVILTKECEDIDRAKKEEI